MPIFLINKIASKLRTTLYLRYCSWIFILFFVSTVAWSQEEQPAPLKERNPAKIKYAFRMEQSAKELKWSNIYYQSFKRTNETSYLRLSAQHCLNAIQSLNETQSMLSKTTRFHYEAKSKKNQACQFYITLQKISHRLAQEHHLENVDSYGCDF